jgi:hypothetical protein
MQTKNAQFTPPPMTTPPPQQPEPQQAYTPPPPPQRNPDTNVNDFVNQMTGAYANDEAYTMEEEYQEPIQEPKQSTKAIVISDGTSKPKGSRGRPKKGK